MARKAGNIFRTTISVPIDLKERMDAAGDVNWSAVACRAFEAELAEIASRKERKTMEDVLQRLRASKQHTENEQYKAGEQTGRGWAETQAEVDQLQRLERLREGMSGRKWQDCFDDAGRVALGLGGASCATWLDSEINPPAADPGIWPEAAPDDFFWERILGGYDYMWQCDDPAFVKGFAEGALTLWSELKAKL